MTSSGRASGRRFDRDHGVTTQALFLLSQLGDATGPAFAHATHYEPVPVQTFHALLSYVPEAFVRRSIFVDVGSGMGRGVLLASEHPFAQVVGIELSPALDAIARTNLTSARNFAIRCRDVRLRCGDARRARFPKGNLVVFLFNPFDDAILRSVLDRVLTSRSEQDEVVLIYYVPVHCDVLQEYDSQILAKPTDALVARLLPSPRTRATRRIR